MAAVDVAFVMSFARNVRREPVEVADERFERKSWSWVAPAEVLTTSNLAWGEEVAIPTLPLVAARMDCADTYRVVLVALVVVALPVMVRLPTKVDDAVERNPPESVASPVAVRVEMEVAPAVKASGPMSMAPKPEEMAPEESVPTVTSEDAVVRPEAVVTPEPSVVPESTLVPLIW